MTTADPAAGRGPGAGPVVVLVGPPGAGKSTVGALLAARLGVGLRDTDDDIVSATGRQVSEIFVDDGEAGFRELERDAVAAALAEHRGVLALGGGSVLDATTRRRLHGHRVVYLRVGLADAVRRVGLGAGRPLLLGNVRSQLKALLDARDPLYREVATSTVDTGDRTADDISAELAAATDVSRS